MALVDPRKIFLESISLSRSIVDYTPSIILLFGGEINIKDPQPCSVREMLVEYCHANDVLSEKSIRLAEHYKDWFEESYYDDLLSFEEELSQLASITVIILESPGAIAELGAFCVNEKINKNLVIVLSENHHQSKSFITLGPLRKINNESILVYDWNYEEMQSSVSGELPFLAYDIQKHLKKQGIEPFDFDNIGHLSFLIHELLIQFKALTSQELTEYINILGVAIKPNKTRRLIYLLRLLELIKIREKGNRKFYYATCRESRLAFSGQNPESRIDYSDLNLSLMRYYSTTRKEGVRFKIISQEHEANEGE
jgi:hypothetical protein